MESENTARRAANAMGGRTMKLSAFLCSYGALYDAGATTKQVVDAAIKQGFGAIEPFPTEDLDTVEQARELGKYIRGAGLSVSCFSTCAELLGPEGAENVRLMRRRIDMAAAMGAPYFHHTIHPQLTLPRAGELSYLQALQQAVPELRELCAYAADRGVLCVYEDQGLYFNGCEGMRRLTEALDGAPFGLVADLGNILFVDEQPEDYIGAFSSRIVHVHCKDYLRKPGSEPCPGKGWYVTRHGDYLRDTICGHGAVNFPACFRVLDQMGYDGWYSLEYAAMEPASFGIGYALENLRQYHDLIRMQRVQLPTFEGVSPKFL